MGEKDVEERFRNAEEKARDRSAILDGVLKDVLNADTELSDLMEALKEINHPLTIHEPVHVTLEDVQRQLK